MEYKTQRKGQFKKGNPGKQRGTQNKLTRTVKETVLSVFNELQNDPKANLKSWAKQHPSLFYPLAAKLIPTEVSATVFRPKAGLDALEETEVIYE